MDSGPSAPRRAEYLSCPPHGNPPKHPPTAISAGATAAAKAFCFDGAAETIGIQLSSQTWLPLDRGRSDGLGPSRLNRVAVAVVVTKSTTNAAIAAPVSKQYSEEWRWRTISGRAGGALATAGGHRSACRHYVLKARSCNHYFTRMVSNEARMAVAYRRVIPAVKTAAVLRRRQAAIAQLVTKPF